MLSHRVSMHCLGGKLRERSLDTNEAIPQAGIESRITFSIMWDSCCSSFKTMEKKKLETRT